VQDPIHELESAAPDPPQWAIFCAASKDYLRLRSDLPCPDWVTAPTYHRLAEPLFTSLRAPKLQVQARILRETPEPFSRHNIYCGNKEPRVPLLRSGDL
jgi:hypothetical protein